MEDDGWEDLFAVVRSSSSSSTCHGGGAGGGRSALPFFSTFQLPDHHRPNLLCYPPRPCADRAALQELEQLCKPFLRQQPPTHHLPRSLHAPLPTRRASELPSPPAGRSKRRKSQQKRVVCQVPADGLSSDMWAWRKYGQKPIKGSPFPRGYYRCSSSKGCLARKQVERSRKDPSMFVITYTAEHNHPVPTHRNSLAGSTRPRTNSSSSSVSVAKFVRQRKSRREEKEAAPVSAASSAEEKKEDDNDNDDDEGEGEGEGEVEGEEEEGVVLMREMEMLGEDEEMVFLQGFDDFQDAAICL